MVKLSSISGQRKGRPSKRTLDEEASQATGVLSFLEDSRLEGEWMWLSCAVVGDKIVAMPSHAGKIGIYDVGSGVLSFLEDSQAIF